MENKLEGKVNHLQFIDCAIDAAKQNKEPQDRPPKQQEKAYLGLSIYKNQNQTSKDDK